MSKKGGGDGGEDPADAADSLSGMNASVEAVAECDKASPRVPRVPRVARTKRGALRLLEADEMLICAMMLCGGGRNNLFGSGVFIQEPGESLPL